jgi:hypothetical protein
MQSIIIGIIVGLAGAFLVNKLRKPHGGCSKCQSNKQGGNNI